MVYTNLHSDWSNARLAERHGAGIEISLFERRSASIHSITASHVHNIKLLGVRIRIMPRARYIWEKQHEQSCNTKGS